MERAKKPTFGKYNFDSVEPKHIQTIYLDALRKKSELTVKLSFFPTSKIFPEMVDTPNNPIPELALNEP